MKSIIFIHRSVGHNLIVDGKIRELVDQGSVLFSDYDQNIDTLTSADGSEKECGFQFPDNDTKPADYAKVFSNNTTEHNALIRDFFLGYDIVIIKSCYPNSNISNNEEIERLKDSYTSIARFFEQYPEKRLVILSSPPLVPLMTNSRKAYNARVLSNWLATEELGNNTSVFNFYDLLADPRKHSLRREYRRFLPFDSHPNKKASAEIAPKFVKFIMTRTS